MYNFTDRSNVKLLPLSKQYQFPWILNCIHDFYVNYFKVSRVKFLLSASHGTVAVREEKRAQHITTFEKDKIFAHYFNLNSTNHNYKLNFIIKCANVTVNKYCTHENDTKHTRQSQLRKTIFYFKCRTDSWNWGLNVCRIIDVLLCTFQKSQFAFVE